MTDKEDKTEEKIEDNLIHPFQLETSNLRGRILRLGSVLDEILDPHKYPETVAHMAAESVCLSLLLSFMLKYDGTFTLQTKGDGPVSMLVSDVTSDGAVRGCAAFDVDRIDHAVTQLAAMDGGEDSQNQYAQLLGKGHMAFTVDQGDNTDRYQGIVELKGASLVDCVQHYFNMSEQIQTAIRMSVGMRDGKWRAGAIMLQNMPEDNPDLQSGVSNIGEDDWRRTMILLGSCTDDELLDPDLHSHQLLFRLFHEEGVRVFDSQPLHKGCRCSGEKVEKLLMMMPSEDREDIVEDDKIVMTCEFCNYDFVFDPKDIQRKIDRIVRSS